MDEKLKSAVDALVTKVRSARPSRLNAGWLTEIKDLAHAVDILVNQPKVSEAPAEE